MLGLIVPLLVFDLISGEVFNFFLDIVVYRLGRDHVVVRVSLHSLLLVPLLDLFILILRRWTGLFETLSHKWESNGVLTALKCTEINFPVEGIS